MVKMKYRNNIMAYLCLLVLALSFTACKGKEKEMTEHEDEVSIDNPSESSQTESNQNGGNTVVVDTSKYPEGSVTFSTAHSYKKMLNLYLNLEEGIKASDITEISFTLDTEMPLEIRMYAGKDSVQKSGTTELTSSTVETVASLDGNETVDVDGNSIQQDNYTLSLENKNSSRFYLVEGNGQKITLAIDEKAKKVLDSIDGETLMIGLYANNIAPEFTIYQLTYVANGNSYEVQLDETTAKPSQGSSLAFH